MEDGFNFVLFYFSAFVLRLAAAWAAVQCCVSASILFVLFVWHFSVVVCALGCFAFFVFVGTHTAHMLQCSWLFLLHSVLAVACGCRSPAVLVGERRRWWSCAPVGEGRRRPLLTVTVFAAGDLARWRYWCNHQPRWTGTAPRLSLPSSSSEPTADTRGARQRHDYKQDVYESTDRKIVWTLVPRVWLLPPYFFIRPCVCAVCAYGAAACCAMLTHVREERRLKCLRTANSPLLFNVTISSFGALDGRRF
ncbi:hypothetical protein TCDM_11963 [Trypanosoma cruzi Dm28c]|uniref:Uncharacterized protein n=1 Tax=Trypanosoma cruzi Dm28c TaxID=1416333 RepID=V5AZ30_TRYCR|nr:hypothetical protein TCDM_11963 [Trypanosoma cruzi Dm28c]